MNKREESDNKQQKPEAKPASKKPRSKDLSRLSETS